MKHSLKRILTLTLSAGGVLLFVSLAAYMVDRERQVILDIYQENTLRTARLIGENISRMMNTGNVHQIADNISAYNIPGQIHVGIAAPDGKPALKTSLPLTQTNELPTAESFFRDGEDIVLFMPLTNRKACHTCHNPNDRIRGIIVVRNQMTGLTEAIRHTVSRLLIAALVLGIFVTSLLMWFINRKIVSPLDKLIEGIRSFTDGDYQKRVHIDTTDEFGTLATAFNRMAGNIAASHDIMEKTVTEKTTELRVIAELSLEIFKGDLSLHSIVCHLADAVVNRMGYDLASICLVDRETGTFSRDFHAGIGHKFCRESFLLSSAHPLAVVARNAVPITVPAAELGIDLPAMRLAVVPILSHRRKRCREINLCLHNDCPAYDSQDSRCWLIKDTLCRSPQARAGSDKVFGCLRCQVFPVLGVLIAGKTGELSDSSMHSVEILASTIASAVEHQALLEQNKNDIQTLLRLHTISVDSLQHFDDKIIPAVVAHAMAFSNTDAAIFWSLEHGNILIPQYMECVERRLLPAAIPLNTSMLGRAISEDRPIEALEMNDIACLGDAIRFHGFLHMIVIPLRFRQKTLGCLSLFRKKDFLLTDAEKAITLLFASQAASALHAVHMYNELRAERDFSEAIFSSASSGIIVLDKSGTILKLNAIAAKTLRLDISKAEGLNFVSRYPEAREILTVVDGFPREILLSIPDGVTVPIGYNTSLLTAPATGEEAFIVILKDLTETYKLREQLRKKEHFEVMGRVVAGVAHEIRNPLFGISSIGQILKQELESEKHTILVDALLKETGRMNRLIEELLLCTRPSNLELRDIDLLATLHEILPAVQARRPDLCIETTGGIGTMIRADRDKLIQVLLNLLNNAADAAKRRVLISFTAGESEKIITIHDDGNGIADKHLQRVFEPFFTTKKQGTGLGLPICKKIVEDHGWTIDLASSEENGTTVTIAIPA